MKIVVNYPSAKVFINGSSQPTLEIEQLSDSKYNRLGLWIDSVDGWFTNISVTNDMAYKTEPSETDHLEFRNRL